MYKRLCAPELLRCKIAKPKPFALACESEFIFGFIQGRRGTHHCTGFFARTGSVASPGRA